MLHVLEETYPEWLSSRQVSEICRVLRPDWNWERSREIHAAKALSRLHGSRVADRIGRRGDHFVGRVPGTDWKRGWRRNAGFRYRIIRRTESLL